MAIIIVGCDAHHRNLVQLNQDLQPKLFMRKSSVFALLVLFATIAWAQQTPHKKISVGVEQDVLPYVTGRYFAGAWIGRDHIRIRAITAKVHKPDFIIKDGFTNNKVKAYAFLADYFLKSNWKGWWAGTGLVYWKNSIQTNARLNTGYYDTWLFNGSIGYNFKLGQHFYIGPWSGLHFKIGGDKHVIVDGKTFMPPFVNSEASVKFGAYF